jgi:hypothetical protein
VFGGDAHMSRDNNGVETVRREQAIIFIPDSTLLRIREIGVAIHSEILIAIRILVWVGDYWILKG